jgi:hypothetical protein
MVRIKDGTTSQATNKNMDLETAQNYESPNYLDLLWYLELMMQAH